MRWACEEASRRRGERAVARGSDLQLIFFGVIFVKRGREGGGVAVVALQGQKWPQVPPQCRGSNTQGMAGQTWRPEKGVLGGRVGGGKQAVVEGMWDECAVMKAQMVWSLWRDVSMCHDVSGGE